jgi:hypothetical protein
MSDRKQDEAEASGWPRHIGLHTAREAGAVAAFHLASLEAGERQPTIAINFSPKQVERLTSDRGVVREVLGDCVLVELHGHHWRRPGIGHRLALAVCGELPEVLLELLRGQLTLPVTSEHRFHAQVRSQEDATVRTAILNYIISRKIPGERDVGGLHP